MLESLFEEKDEPIIKKAVVEEDHSDDNMEFEDLFEFKNYYEHHFSTEKTKETFFQLSETKEEWSLRNTQKFKEITNINNLDINILKNFNYSNIACKLIHNKHKPFYLLLI